MGRDLLALATDNVLARHVLGEVHLCSPDVSDSACITLPQPIDHFWSIAGNDKEIVVDSRFRKVPTVDLHCRSTVDST